MTAANEALQIDDNALEKKRAETMLPTPSGPEPQRPRTEVTMRSAGQQYSRITPFCNREPFVHGGGTE